MKLFKFSIALIAGLLLFNACNKDIETTNNIQAYDYASIDADGGDWKPVLLATNADVPLPAPAAVGDAAYQTELQATKTASTNLTASQQAAVDYWGGNGVVRWNEIARELAAKYNLPPVANADGTYPVPNSMTPDVYPYFPFANPPYVSRMFAYWSAAQYDALVSAWHYKQLYNRPAPYKTDASIATHLPKNDLPSYPSEDAVIASVSETILTAMFPVEKAYIAAKAAEHRQSRLWAGMNTQSDLSAGDSLGTKVAKKFLARAKNDKMGVANGTAALRDSLAGAAHTAFGWDAWVSLETPLRPGMLCRFGQVMPWLIPSAAAVRPGPPPAIGSDEFNRAAAELKDFQDNPTAEQRRIANFWSDGVSSYTPPGHWNRLAGDYIVAARLNPLRSARVLAYMNMAIEDAGISCWDTKYTYYYPRPSQAIPGFRAVLGVPNFPSYTSGHSTFSGAAAVVLAHLFPEHTTEVDAWASEASVSRIYGGIHYRFDCEVGLQVGRTIGGYAVTKAQADGAE